MGPSLSALKGGEGQFALDRCQHAREVLQDSVVPEPDDAVTAPSDFVGAQPICIDLRGMLSAVEFNDQICCGTGEIGDVAADRVLAAKTNGRECIAQRPPKTPFGIGGLAAQPPREP